MSLRDNVFDSDPGNSIRLPVGETTVDCRLGLDFDFAYSRSNSIGSVQQQRWPDSMLLDSMATDSSSNLKHHISIDEKRDPNEKRTVYMVLTKCVVHILSLIGRILSLRIDA